MLTGPPAIIIQPMQEAKPFSLPLSANGLNATLVRAGKGAVVAFSGSNTATEPRYLKFYDTDSTPNVGSDIPIWTETLDAQSKFQNPPMLPITFTNGIAFAVTGGATTDDATAIQVGDISGFNFSYY